MTAYQRPTHTPPPMHSYAITSHHLAINSQSQKGRRVGFGGVVTGEERGCCFVCEKERLAESKLREKGERSCHPCCGEGREWIEGEKRKRRKSLVCSFFFFTISSTCIFELWRNAMWFFILLCFYVSECLQFLIILSNEVSFFTKCLEGFSFYIHFILNMLVFFMFIATLEHML